MHILTLTTISGEGIDVATRVVAFMNRAAAEGAAQAWQSLEIVQAGHARVEVVSMTGFTSPTNWGIVSGQTVSVGDMVALDIAPGTFALIVGVTDRGLPHVEIAEGKNVGKRLQAWPSQILFKRHTSE